MQVIVTQKDSATVVHFNGRLDTASSPEAEKQLLGQIADGADKVVVDFEGTDYISSSGLRVLLKAAKNLQQNAGTFAICNGNTQVKEVLEISGFLTIMKYFETLEDAVRFVQS